MNNVKRLLAVLLTVVLLASLVPVALADGDVISIRTADDLVDLAANCTLDSWSVGKTVKLEADIDLTEQGFAGIPTFGGTFEGNGHTISGLDITGGAVPAGLFAHVQENARVRNLNVSGSVMPDGDARSVGGIVGENSGTVIGCTFTGSVAGENYIGAIAGINTAAGRVEDCKSSGGVFGSGMTGGIVGYNMGTVSGCDNHAYVNITNADATPELEELNLDFLLDLSKLSDVDTSGVASDTGGIAGYSAGVLTDCANYGTVGYPHVGYNVGGIAGRSCGYIWDCINSADVYGRKDVGGIVGQIEPYIALNVSENTMSILQNQLNTLNDMVKRALDDANAGVGSVTTRLNRIADYADTAADALNDLGVTGSVQTTVAGGVDAGAAGAVIVDPSQVVVSSGLDVNVEAESAFPGVGAGVDVTVQAGLTPGSLDAAGSGGVSGSLDADTQIVLNMSVGGLTAAINGMLGQVRLLDGEIAGISGVLTSDLKNISDQVNSIANTLTDALLNTSAENVLTDTSGVDIEAATLGKTANSQNDGSIYADINVGGIVGAMAIEYELDPEDDVTAEISSVQRRSYELKAVVLNCTNTGAVKAKRSYSGGICGRMDLGLITGCGNVGSVTSEQGDYVGGVAGIAGSTVRSSYAKAALTGNSYVGGIVGNGVEEDSGGASSTVAGCYAIVDIPKYEQYVGAISGGRSGVFTENYFVSDVLAGINGLSYAGKAEPIAYEDLFAVTEGSEEGTQPVPVHTVPDAFRFFTLTFVADDVVLKEVEFPYGASFDRSIFPELPKKSGYHAEWSTEKLENLHFNTVVSAEYTPYTTALAGEPERADGRSVFFVEGAFDEGAVFTAAMTAITPEDFDLADGFEDTLLKCFQGTKLNREVVEQWELTVTGDEKSNHRVRYLPPDGETENVDIYTNSGSGWQRVPTEAVGSYLTFTVPGERAQIAAVSTMNVWWVWLIAAALILLVIGLLVGLIVRLTRRSKAKKAAYNAAWKNLDDMAARAAAAGEMPPETAAYPKKRSKVWIVVLIIVFVLILAAAAGVHFLLPDLKTDVEAYYLLRETMAQEELSLDLAVEGSAGDFPLNFNACIDTMRVDAVDVTRIKQDEMALFYANGVVYLENGRGYRVTGLYPDYSELLDLTAALYRNVDIKAEDGVYTITAKEAEADELLQLLAPGQELAELDAVTVELVADGRKLSAIRFYADGEVQGIGVTVSAVLTVAEKRKVTLPAAVQSAIADGDAGVQELSGDLLRLISAWVDLENTDPLVADVTLSADCGPIVLRNNWELDRTTVDGLTIYALQKSGYALYFTDKVLCDKDGHVISKKTEDGIQAVRLLDIAYELCQTASFTCTEAGGAITYTVALDAEGMEHLANAIAPATKELDTFFTDGSMQVVLKEERIESIVISCGGTLKIAQSEADISVGAQLSIRDGASFAVPDDALHTLKENHAS